MDDVDAARAWRYATAPAGAAAQSHGEHSYTCSPSRSRVTISQPDARKSMLTGVDIGRRAGYGFSRSRDQEGPGRHELPGSSRQLHCAGRCGGGVPKPELSQDGDGTDGRTGWPAVIRGRQEQYRSTRSAVLEWFPGKGVGCGRACREVRQWSSKPGQMQDRRRGRLPKCGAVQGRSSTRYR